MASDKDTLSPLAAAQAELARANRKVLLDDQLLDALHSFEQIMAYRNELHMRLSRRVRATVRGGMAVFAMVGLAMFLLLITLVMQVEHARESSRLLARHVTAVAADMAQIESTVMQMEHRMERFATISGYMNTMTDYTGNIAGGMQQLDSSMTAIRGQMVSINNRLARINHHVGTMGNAVGGMGHSMGEIARPAGMFP